MTIYDHEIDCNCEMCNPPIKKRIYWRLCGWLQKYGCDGQKNNFGMAYCQFLHLVCDDCKHPCWAGEEHCERLDRMSEEFGFR